MRSNVFIMVHFFYLLGEEGSTVKYVNSSSIVMDNVYCPEIHVCAYLDEQFPEEERHHIYTYYAREFTIAKLTLLYERIALTHAVDAIIIMDGGSDSLMRGDEHALGDPIEDAVSLG